MTLLGASLYAYVARKEVVDFYFGTRAVIHVFNDTEEVPSDTERYNFIQQEVPADSIKGFA